MSKHSEMLKAEYGVTNGELLARIEKDEAELNAEFQKTITVLNKRREDLDRNAKASKIIANIDKRTMGK